MPVRLQTTELRTLIDKILSAYLEQFEPAQDIVIREDYFWVIEQENLYDLTHDPADFTLGSLQEIVPELQKLANQESSYVSTTVDLRRLSFLLRYLSGI